MEIIPFPYHLAAICGLVILAAHRRNLFPFVLVTMYAAVFYLIDLSFKYEMALSTQLVISGTLAALLFMFAIESKRREFIKRFCFVMILSILNSIFIYALSPIEAGVYYLAAQYSTAFISFSLSIAEFYILTRIIYGTSRGEPIISTLGVNILAVLSHFQYDCKALPASVWQKRAKVIGRQKRQG